MNGILHHGICKGLSEESIKTPVTSDNSLNPLINYCYNNKIRAKFNGSCLKQNNLHYKHKNVANIYIVYQMGASTSNINGPTLKNCLFRAVTLAKNADFEKLGILFMELDLIEDQVFHFQVVDLVEMY